MGSLFRRISGKAARAKTMRFEQISYQAAFSLLPHYIFVDPIDGNRHILIQAPRAAGIKHMIGVCILAKFEPDESLMKRIAETQGHSGELCEGVQYRIIEYPKPDPIDLDMEELDQLPPEQTLEKLATVVPAPYFSILLLNDKFEALEFLVLSQAPDGSAALRQVNHESNKDLRLRCEPRLEPLLTLLKTRREQPA